MPPISISIEVTPEGLQYLTQATDSLNALGAAGQSSNQGTGAATSGLDDLVKGATNARAGIEAITGAITQGGGMISAVDQIGVSSLRSRDALDHLTGGNSLSWIKDMSTASHGLVDSQTLARDAADALAKGIVVDQAEMRHLTADGAALGIAMGNTAAGGITDVENALERVGNKRSLYNLGVDVQGVEAEYKSLRGTLGDVDAWHKAIFDNMDTAVAKYGDVLDNGAGTAVDRLNAKWTDFKTHYAENFATGADSILKSLDLMNDKSVTFVRTMQAVSAEFKGDLTAFDLKQLGGTQGPAAPLDPSTDLFQRYIAGQATAGTQYGGPAQFAPQQAQDTVPVGAFRGSWADYYRSDQWQQQSGYMNQFEMSSPEGQRFGMEENQPQGKAFGGRYTGGYHPASSFQPGGGDDTVRGIQAASGAVANYSAGWQQAESIVRQHEITVNSLAKAIPKSIDAAFQINGSNTDFNPMYAQTGGNLAQDAAAERANLVKHGAGKGQLAQFDAKTAMDINQFKIDTHQATPESLAFEGALTKIDKAAASGKISIGEAAKEIKALTDAGASGKATLDFLDKLTIGGVNNAGGGGPTPDRWNDRGTGDGGKGQSGLTTAKGTNPIKEVATDLGKASANADTLNSRLATAAGILGGGFVIGVQTIDHLPTAMTNAAAKMVQPGVDVANTIKPTIANIQTAQKLLDGFMNSLRGSSGTLTVSMGFSGSPNGTGAGSGAGGQGGGMGGTT